MSTFYPYHGEKEPFQAEPEEGQVANEIVLPDPELAPAAEGEEEESGAADDASAEPDPGSSEPEKKDENEEPTADA